MHSPPHPCQLVVLVGLGGAVGALGRYGVGLLLPASPAGLPFATVLVNLTGCLALGLLVGLRPAAVRLRAFVGTGICGGFTTLSALALEVDQLLPIVPGVAALHLILSTVGGPALAALGLRLGRSRAQTHARRTTGRP